MAQKLVNTQIQEQQLAQVQQQRLNAQQVMFVRMLEMPLTQYEEYVKTEIDENPALEPDIQENSDSDDRYETTDMMTTMCQQHQQAMPQVIRLAMKLLYGETANHSMTPCTARWANRT